MDIRLEAFDKRQQEQIVRHVQEGLSIDEATQRVKEETYKEYVALLSDCDPIFHPPENAQS